MEVKIDSNAEFKVNGKEFAVDAYELSEFKRMLFETKGKKDPDKPDEPATLEWVTIISDTQAFVKTKTNIDLVASEAIAVFLKADKVWGDVQKNWRGPIEALPISPPSTDPRYAD